MKKRAKVNTLTPSVERRICNLIGEGISGPEIARRVDVSHTAVFNVAMRHNLTIVRREKHEAGRVIRPPGANTDAERAAFRRFLGA